MLIQGRSNLKSAYSGEVKFEKVRFQGRSFGKVHIQGRSGQVEARLTSPEYALFAYDLP
jgi:hypothetical protein